MTRPISDSEKAGASVVGVGVAACAACCAVLALGSISALVAGTSIAALAASGLRLASVRSGR